MSNIKVEAGKLYGKYIHGVEIRIELTREDGEVFFIDLLNNKETNPFPSTILNDEDIKEFILFLNQIENKGDENV